MHDGETMDMSWKEAIADAVVPTRKIVRDCRSSIFCRPCTFDDYNMSEITVREALAPGSNAYASFAKVDDLIVRLSKTVSLPFAKEVSLVSPL